MIIIQDLFLTMHQGFFLGKLKSLDLPLFIHSTDSNSAEEQEREG